MLALSRKVGEIVDIGEGYHHVEVVVFEIRGDTVHLGIRAPQEIPIDRREVRRRKEADHDH